jgi:HEPN domain-containing protein
MKATAPSAEDFAKLASRRLEDARALHAAGRYEGAVYLSGYAIEFALKARICKHLGWKVFRDDLATMKTHDLNVLVSFTGLENERESFITEWSNVSEWRPEMRYTMVNFTETESRTIIEATEQLMEKFL